MTMMMMKKKGQLRWLPGICNNVKVRTPPRNQYRLTQNSIFADEFSSSSNGSEVMNFNGCKLKQQEDGGNNKVVVVVDPSLDAKGAIQWVFSHTVQAGDDTLLLLQVIKPSATEFNRQKAYELLSSMKQNCQIRKPEVRVEIMIVEGEDKGESIVEQVKYQKASLLVLGQRMQSSMASRFKKMCSVRRSRRSSSGGRVVEYCIQNANCLAIAVRKKSRKKHGGYLITTKRHKNFWLLA